MITKDKVTEIFCIIDEFDKNFESELKKNLLPVTDGKQHRNRKASLSDSEIMTILLLFHFGTYRNFKHYYIYYIREHMKRDFPNAVSYNRFIELEQRVFFKLVFFLKLFAFGRCSGISFVDSSMIPVCHNLRRYAHSFISYKEKSNLPKYYNIYLIYVFHHCVSCKKAILHLKHMNQIS